MNLNTILLPVLTALICSALISFTCTPTASFIAYKIGAIDVPTDGRRMHKKPIPRLGVLPFLSLSLFRLLSTVR